MKTKIIRTLVLAFLLGPVSAYATIFSTVSGTFTLIDGADPLGLAGASFTLNSTYDSAAVYILRPINQAVVDALTHSFNISGASVAASNGAWTDPQGLAIYPTFPGQFFGGGPTDGDVS